MIGSISNANATYTLNDKGIWEGEDDLIVDWLNTMYTLENVSKADGVPGYLVIGKAAKELNMTAKYASMEGVGV